MGNSRLLESFAPSDDDFVGAEERRGNRGRMGVSVRMVKEGKRLGRHVEGEEGREAARVVAVMA